MVTNNSDNFCTITFSCRGIFVERLKRPGWIGIKCHKHCHTCTLHNTILVSCLRFACFIILDVNFGVDCRNEQRPLFFHLWVTIIKIFKISLKSFCYEYLHVRSMMTILMKPMLLILHLLMTLCADVHILPRTLGSWEMSTQTAVSAHLQKEEKIYWGKNADEGTSPFQVRLLFIRFF